MLLFHMSCAIWVSYYKLAPTKKIHVIHGSLDEYQKSFWETFYIQWLGEFFYTNDLDPAGLAKFSSSEQIHHQKANYELEDRYLVPIWWGKDSCVTIEQLRATWKECVLYTNGKDYPLHQDVAEVAGHSRIVTPRTIDPLLIKLSKEWYLNGHVPITGIISFISVLVTYFHGESTIVFSNEHSANFWNTNWKWLDINHQWSKSLDFEEAFQSYIKTYIHEEVRYYSQLRSLFEAAIAKSFSDMKQYHRVFSSCNRNFHLDGARTKRWCLICPKCLFTYAMMRPYLEKDEVLAIWWEELYKNKKNLKLFQELWGVSWIKPFECVWTYDEIQYATYAYIEKLRSNTPNIVLPEILSWFTKNVVSTKSPVDWKQLGEDLLQSTS